MIKRGQAAMEFLMTYGWAILAAIVAIAALAYFGIFNPSKISGDRIIVTAPFHAVASQVLVTTTPEVNFEVSAQLNKQLTLNNVIITGNGPNGGVTCDIPAPIVLDPNIITIINVPCTGTLNEGDTLVADIKIIYTISGTTIWQLSSGKLKALAQ